MQESKYNNNINQEKINRALKLEKTTMIALDNRELNKLNLEHSIKHPIQLSASKKKVGIEQKLISCSYSFSEQKAYLS